MNTRDANERIAKLKKEIEHHRYLYHVLDQQEISDAALDSLKKELADLEERYPEFVTPDSPTQRVGGAPLTQFKKIEHRSRMLSLNDAFGEEDVRAWVKRLEKVEPHIGKAHAFFAEPKIDGLALSLVYENGVLAYGATRGDGRIGEDVTHNIRTIQTVPLRLQQHPSLHRAARIEVRGEVYMTKKAFAAINKEREARGESLFMNPRNTAAGSIRQLDPSLAARRPLRFLAYSLVTDLGQTTHHEEHELLKALGFYTDPDARICATIEDVFALYEAIGCKREQLPNLIDGIVVTVDDTTTFERLGVVGKAPRGAIAMKFPAEQATTVVEDIQVQVGRTGALTPVAHLRPVRVAGSTVARATLHNMDEIHRLGVRIGDTVIVQKAGDVIPDIVRVLTELRSWKERAFRMPKRCPLCKAPTTKRDKEVAYYCSNPECFGQQKERFYHFVSQQGLNIDGLGPRIIDQLIDSGLVITPADLFDLTEGDLLPLERFAEQSAQNLISAIHTARRVSLARLIFALGIRHVGQQTAIALAEQFHSMRAFRRATQEQLESVPDIGVTVAESIVQYVADKKNQEFVDALSSRLTIIAPQRAMQHTQLSGKTVLFTGTLQQMTRDDAKERVRAAGGKVSSAVSKSVDYLVVGAAAGSKLTKARTLGVSVLTEQEFLKLLDTKPRG